MSSSDHLLVTDNILPLEEAVVQNNENSNDQIELLEQRLIKQERVEKK